MGVSFLKQENMHVSQSWTSGTLAPNATMASATELADGEEAEARLSSDFYIGLFLAIGSSVFIGSSFILKKKALLNLAAKDSNSRASKGGYGYLLYWMWWAGVLTMGVGEACNFAAYAFAPATLVTPLGSLSVLVTTILSSKLLNEKLNLLGKIGCAICVLGSCVIVLHSPKEENVGSMFELGMKMQEPAFILYVAFVIILSLGLIFYVAPRYGESNILVFICICSVVGSLSVLGCKGVGIALKETFSGNNQLKNGLTWFLLFSVIVCVTVQLNYLNRSLDIFNTAMVTPIYYVFFTSFVILASGILFNEWVKLGAEDVFGNVAGFLITIIGIFQMQLFKGSDSSSLDAALIGATVNSDDEYGVHPVAISNGKLASGQQNGSSVAVYRDVPDGQERVPPSAQYTHENVHSPKKQYRRHPSATTYT